MSVRRLAGPPLDGASQMFLPDSSSRTKKIPLASLLQRTVVMWNPSASVSGVPVGFLDWLRNHIGYTRSIRRDLRFRDSANGQRFSHRDGMKRSCLLCGLFRQAGIRCEEPHYTGEQNV